MFKGMNALNVISFFNHFNEVKLIYSTGVQDGIPAGEKSQETLTSRFYG